MRLAFIGTDRLGAAALKELADNYHNHEVVLTITQPDRPKGRGRTIVPGEVKLLTEAYRIPVLQPETIKDPSVIEALEVIQPEIIVVVSYGEYIPKSIYTYPKFGSINLHPSLLPRWRGAAPVQYALLEGDKTTGVTVQYVHRKMDAGDVLMQEQVDVSQDDNHGSLCDKLYPLGAKMLVQVLDGLAEDNLTAVTQDESKVTYARKIEKDDYWLDWSESNEKIRNRIRAFAPIPGARMKFRQKDFKILEAKIYEGVADGKSEPGEIIDISDMGPVIGCGDGGLIITSLQPPGKNPQRGVDFLNGYRPEKGEKFESREIG